MTTGFKNTLMEILDGSPKHTASRYVELMITVVVLVNCSAVILDSVPEIHAEFKDFFHELEFWSVMFFTGEYISRVWSLGAKYNQENGGSWKGRFEYMFSAFGLVDFFATMPYYMHMFLPGLDLRILRVLRLLRILKLSKYNTALQDLFHAIHSERQAFGSAVFLLTIATIVSASLMHFAEGHHQPPLQRGDGARLLRGLRVVSRVCHAGRSVERGRAGVHATLSAATSCSNSRIVRAI